MSGRWAAWAPALLVVVIGACVAPPGRVFAPSPRRPLRGRWYGVQAGERLAQLATRFRVPLDDLEELNGLAAADALTPGQRIFIPELAATAPRGPAPGVAPAGAGLPIALSWPLEGGTLSSRFGRRGRGVHEGLDLVAPAGSPVLAAAAGVVIYAGAKLRGYGNLVLLRHRGGVVTVYAHNRRIYVREGQGVRRGEVIAEVGRSGRASTDHLHFELRRGEEPIDPLPHLPAR